MRVACCRRVVADEEVLLRIIATLIASISMVAFALGSAQAGGPPCAPGSYGANGFEPCFACDAGTFAANPGSTSCEPCGLGTHAPSVGSSSCQSCEPGSFAAQPGSIACSLCEPGRFTDISGATQCQDCPPGYFADQLGQTSCLLCNAGTFAAEPASSSCQPCAAGNYSDVLGATACTECSPGTASAQAGANSSQACVPCPAGTFAANAGSSACGACPRNTHASAVGQTQCLACGCDDALACTRDSCNVVSGACTAPAVSGCQPIDVPFSGMVTFADPTLAAATPLGSPVEGRFSFDPEAPDAIPLNPILGDYPSAVTGFEVSIGGTGGIVATSPSGSVQITDGFGQGDVVAFYALAADGLDGSPLDAPADGVYNSFQLRLVDASATALTSDAMPAASPDFSRFASRTAQLEIFSPTLGASFVQASDVQSAPEPQAALGIATAIACLLAMRRASER
jgi:hypothetical protein